MSVCTVINSNDPNPEPLVQDYVQQLRDSGEAFLWLLVTYPFEQYWQDEKPQIRLAAFYCLTRQSDSVGICYTVSDQPQQLANYDFTALASGEAGIKALCDALSLPLLDSAQPLPLASVSIAKPWGQEIWYTGVEQRGVVGVGCAELQQPLPYVLSALPTRLCGNHQRSLILLKILDPLPEEVFGDLYFELHQKKREVYVVTHVDEAVWPDGEGEIRFGFNPKKRQQYGSDTEFRHGFASAVKQYEAVRRQIDDIVDQERAREGVDANEPVSAGTLAGWLAGVPTALRREEQRLRDDMESFTDKLALRVGDVVKVPTLTPHSLQHGVRTVEFQTPVYERLIVSFAQKVLTQSYWDTDEAVSLMSLDSAQQEPHPLLESAPGVTVERIVDFEDFEVRRVKLEAGVTMLLASPEQYGLLMTIGDDLSIAGCEIGSGQAVLLPGSWPGEELVNSSAKPMSFLLAYPK